MGFSHNQKQTTPPASIQEIEFELIEILNHVKKTKTNRKFIIIIDEQLAADAVALLIDVEILFHAVIPLYPKFVKMTYVVSIAQKRRCRTKTVPFLAVSGWL